MPYIEKDFPIEQIDEIAWSESNARKPIYHIHKWFARRVGSTFRALILGTFLEEDPMIHYYKRSKLRNKKGNPPIILDPFMGGGTTIIEGHRLGCRMIGIDINPLAWYITRMELKPVEKTRIRKELKRIEEATKNQILSYYRTSCNKGHNADVMYVFWAKKVKCENCSKDVPLYRSFVVAKLRDHWVYQCPRCGEIFSAEKSLEVILCSACASRFSPDNGFATGKIYKCQHCKYQGDILSAVKDTKNPPEHEMYAIEYYCQECEESGWKRRDYKKPDEKDIELYMRANSEFIQKRDQLFGKLIPLQEIPIGFNTNQMRNFNYRYWYQMFNKRQLVCLSLVLEEILKTEDENIKEFLLILFSDSLNSNNMFTVYNMIRLEIEPLFGGHHFWPPVFPIEGNVWGTKYGRGTFRKYFEKALRALEYQQSPYEIRFKLKKGKHGQRKKIRSKLIIQDEEINGNNTSYFEDLLGDRDVLLRCDTAEDLDFIPEKSVDAVITDPPYYANIMYSELSDFFYVWLRLGLEDKDVFKSPLTRKDREILVNATQGKNERFYIEGMTRVLSESHRVLREDGILVFVFQHKKTEAWSAILSAILKAGFYVTAVYPTHGETPSGVRAFGINYNSIIVCRKLLERKHQQVPWVIFESELRSHVDISISTIVDKHPDLEVEDAFIIAMGKALQVYSRNYGNITRDSQVFDVSEVSMEIMGDIVFDSLLRRVLERVPDVDRISKIYASIFAKKVKISNDTINKLTRHGGIETNTFEEEKLVVRDKKKDIMTITPPNERKDFIDKKMSRRIPLTYIDAAHLLWIDREDNGNFGSTLEMILRTGLDKERLGQYMGFMAERTNNTTWKRIYHTFKTSPSKTLEDFGLEVK
ncbi:MAG: DUF1156 domain-containing protein [Theionarchaea archaeon]|nr:DUF1156 domain-containing protein [Theionarchaea archaeon]